MKLNIKKGKTSKLINIFISDSSSTTGAGLTGLVYNSAGLTAHYYREGAGTGATAISLVTATLGTWVSGGFKEIDATNMPGWYELGVPDAVLASGVDFVDIHLKGATNMAPIPIEIQLRKIDMLPYLGSHGMGVFFDDSAANTDTTTETSGTRDNPVSTPAAVKTIADALGIKQVYIINNSTMTLIATMTDWEFIGVGEITSNVLSLGSQNVGRSFGYNICVEGTQGGTARLGLERCALAKITAGTTTLHVHALDCGIVDDISLDTSADNVSRGMYGLVAGTDAPIVRATGAAGTFVSRGQMGGIDIRDLSASHNISIDGMGQVIFDASCNVNATVAIRGLFEITDSTAGMNNLTKTAVYNYDENVVATWDRVLSKANHNVAGSAAKLLRELGVMIAVEGAVSGTPTPTSVTTNITGYDNDFFKDQTFMPYNGAAMAGQSKIITAYNGTTGVFTFGEAFTSALTSGDDVIVFSSHVHSIAEVQSGLATSAALTTHDGKLDTATTNIAAVKAETALIVANTDELQTNQGNWLTATGFFGSGTMTESYAADGAETTPEQAFYQILSALNQFAIVGTALTSYKLDGTTPAMVFLLNDATEPTSRTRTS